MIITDFSKALAERILVLDGAMGTMLQQRGLVGCSDLFTLSHPEVVEDIHRQYIAAGADIIETNTFGANEISLAEYGASHQAREICLNAAAIARRAASEADRKVWMAGSVGPTGLSCSLELQQGHGAEAFDRLAAALTCQMQALIEGGVDILLLETSYDIINARAAAYAARRAMTLAEREVPVVFSITVTESGRTLSGATPEAMAIAVSHLKPAAICLNCGFGADKMLAPLKEISQLPFAIGAYPNAGLPDAMGQYTQTPEQMAKAMRPMMEQRLLNIAGGCCGTTPAHIKAIATEARNFAPRHTPQSAPQLMLCGLDTWSGGGVVGERCNVAGSRKFLRLIKEKNYAEAMQIAASQVEKGADIIDLNLDDSMLDAPAEMEACLMRLAADAVTAKVPVMIDSSHPEVIERALKCVQGRPIVNSISLKDGAEAFVERARHIAEMGAAMVVMAFDEQGQADTAERKIEVCTRAYALLTEAGINPADIIFDPNILAVGTGLPEHALYALHFINAVGEIRRTLPGVSVSGGVSNLSFAFRGNNPLRHAIHAIFLDHARREGMNMAIVNPSTLINPDIIEPELREAIDDLLLNRRDDATERLIELAQTYFTPSEPVAKKSEPIVAQLTPSERLSRVVAAGQTDNLSTLLADALKECGSPLAVIDRCLMPGMEAVGEHFARGEVFLPQVVKSARAMEEAVKWLEPHMDASTNDAKSSSRPVMVLATVKGDVHDIGKNIVAILLRAAGIEVVDLGVMVPAEKIVEAAKAHGASFVGLSGLITPSLKEMCNVAEALNNAGISVPLFVGGAAAGAEHTALRIAPQYNGPVIYTPHAAELRSVVSRLARHDREEQFFAENASAQQAIRRAHTQSSHLPLTVALSMRPEISHAHTHSFNRTEGMEDITFSVAQAATLINYREFFAEWGLDPSLADLAKIDGCDHCRAQWLATLPEVQRAKGAEAMQLLKNAHSMLADMERMGITLTARVITGIATAEDSTIIFNSPTGSITIPTLRHTDAQSQLPHLALADFINPSGQTICVWTVTVGAVMEHYISSRADSYSSLLAQSLAHRLVEAATELMQRTVAPNIKAIRPAVGYESLPDQSLTFLLDSLLNYNDLGITLTENGAMHPSATTTGLLIAHPQARYFSVLPISQESFTAYAKARRLNLNDLSRFLPQE